MLALTSPPLPTTPQDDRWIDLQTRQIRILFNYYNPTVDLFCVAALQLDYKESGGVITSSTFRTIDPQVSQATNPRSIP